MRRRPVNIVSSPAGAFHPANALTYGSLFAGLLAVTFALRGSVSATGALVAFAVILDTFD